MAYYALLNENQVVIQVIAGKDETDPQCNWEELYSHETGLQAKRTSYNTRGGVHYDPVTGEPSADQSKAFRKNYAGIGYRYDIDHDAFISPKPYASWLLNEDSCLWEPPVAMPTDGKMYRWDEATTSWVEIALS